MGRLLVKWGCEDLRSMPVATKFSHRGGDIHVG